mgnify:CR=1 FL=1
MPPSAGSCIATGCAAPPVIGITEIPREGFCRDGPLFRELVRRAVAEVESAKARATQYRESLIPLRETIVARTQEQVSFTYSSPAAGGSVSSREGDGDGLGGGGASGCTQVGGGGLGERHLHQGNSLRVCSGLTGATRFAALVRTLGTRGAPAVGT